MDNVPECIHSFIPYKSPAYNCGHI